MRMYCRFTSQAFLVAIVFNSSSISLSTAAQGMVFMLSRMGLQGYNVLSNTNVHVIED